MRRTTPGTGACEELATGHHAVRRAGLGDDLTDEWLASDGSRVHADEIVLGLQNYCESCSHGF